MSKQINSYKSQINKVFELGIEIVNEARSMKIISLDLKLLAINGIAQAARLNTTQGQSLITLSGFLSQLPEQIAPDLAELEENSRILSRQITLTSISVRRFLQYSSSLDKTIGLELGEQKRNFVKINIFNSKDLVKLEQNTAFDDSDDQMKGNLSLLSRKNLGMIKTINLSLEDAQRIISKSKSIIERIRRNGLSASYMGTYISIESAYLTGSNSNFTGLINNIKEMFQTLDSKLKKILEQIAISEIMLERLLKTSFIK
jgi:hypothetical protein